MSRAIDLNADMGEYQTEEQACIEAALMALITSCSIACGGHAGDEETMRRTARLARQHKVGVGAHPSYPDREGFGRRSMTIDPEMLGKSIRKQIKALADILNEECIPLRHVKPHGALYNDAARDAALSSHVIAAAKDVAADAVIVGPPGSALETAARKGGLGFVAEGFVDRLYQRDGSLTPRTEPGAVIADIDARAAQGAAIAAGKPIRAADGDLTLAVQTLCIHSDSDGAVATAQALRDALGRKQIRVERFSAQKS